MSHLPPWLNYIADPRDQALLLENPTLMMPHYGELPPLPLGRRRYVNAADGLYVQARNHGVSVTVRASQPMPYGRLEPSVVLAGGLIPRHLYEEMERLALDHSPAEFAALVHWNGAQAQYELVVPEVLDRSSVHIKYLTAQTDEDCLVLKLHSHGTGSAFFSEEDDRSDLSGVYFASVLGHCQSRQTLQCISRLVIDGSHYLLDWHPWEQAASGRH